VALWGVQDADLNPPVDDALHEFRFETALGANGYLRPASAHQLKSLQQKLPTAETFKNSDVAACFVVRMRVAARL
jgi:hypothetical protein